MVTTTQTTRLHEDVADVATRAAADLAGGYDLAALAEAQALAVLFDVVPDVVVAYGEAAAAIAADWYDDVRDADRITGRFTTSPADLADVRVEPLIGWADETATNPAAFSVLLLDGLQTRVADWARATIIGSSLADPGADGWQRVASPTACAFCRMLAGRGAVYSEASVDFAAHDKCLCSATPAFGGQPRPVRPYTPTNRYGDTDEGRARHAADLERARDWMAAHGLT
jgi:hypothetical protein